ncbi:hypothetical protein ABZ910_32740, partial [Streptomyces sp. NPDC046805]
MPHALFITPLLATVGLIEKQARRAGRRVRIASQPVAEIIVMPRAYVVEETRGVIKYVLDADTDEVLAAALLGVDAEELINTVVLGMRHGVTVTELRESIYTHPRSNAVALWACGLGSCDEDGLCAGAGGLWPVSVF